MTTYRRDGMYDPVFSREDYERAGEMISRGINPYDEDEARANGVEHIPETIERESSRKEIGKRHLTVRQINFLKDGENLRDIVAVGHDLTNTRINKLAGHFPGRFGRGRKQDLTRENYSPEQIRKIFCRVYDFYKGKRDAK